MELTVAVLGLLLALIAVLFEPAELRRHTAKALSPLARKTRSPLCAPAPRHIQPAATQPPVSAETTRPVTNVAADFRPSRRSGWVHGWRDDRGGVRITVLGGDPRTEAWAQRVFG